MATKKQAKKKKKTRVAKAKPTRKLAPKRKTIKKSAKRMPTPKKAVAKKKAIKRAISATKRPRKDIRKKKRGRASSPFALETPEVRSGGLSGDLQGLSNLESADSESVDELLEEGNAFEAGIISGVQSAGDRSEKEVRTREVLEDDVPEEYLDQD
jgi:hypothetical protein